MGLFDGLFDLNGDGQLDPFEAAVQYELLASDRSSGEDSVEEDDSGGQRFRRLTRRGLR